MNEIRVGIIGAGARSASYMRSIPKDFASRVRLVAIADPQEKNRTLLANQFPTGTKPRF